MLSTSAALASASPCPSIEESALARLPRPVGFFLPPGGWSTIRARIASDPVSARLFEIENLRARALLGQPVVAYAYDGRRLLYRMRSALGRIANLALVGRVTEDPVFVHRALSEFRALTAQPDWNPVHFLDTAEAALALSIGLSWLRDDLGRDEIDAAETALIERALLPSFDPALPHKWVSSRSNWNQVCHAGLVAAALAIAHRDPPLARRVIERALENIGHAADAYAPSGAYPEGPAYWDYGTTYHVFLIELLRSAFGQSFDLERAPGFLESSDYMAQTTTPTGDWTNYADTFNHREFSPALFWFARERARPGIVAWELAALGPHLENLRAGRPPRLDRFQPFALLWWDPALASRPSVPLPLHWYSDGEVPVAVHRSAWDDPRAAYLLLKGGSPSASHGHMDSGSFILETDGVRWAVDIGPENYERIEAATALLGVSHWDYAPDAFRWRVFRLGPESHNIPRFDRAAPASLATTRLVRHRADASAPFTILDLSALYADQVRHLYRGVRMRPADRALTLQDEWSGDHPAAYRFQWLTYSEIALDGPVATLRQNGETLRVTLLDPVGAVFGVEDASAPPAPHDSAHPGLRRLTVDLPPSAGPGRLVLDIQPGAPAPFAPPSITPFAYWR